MVVLVLVGSACKRRVAKMKCPPFPAVGVSLDATRESYRRGELRRQLRYREAIRGNTDDGLSFVGSLY